jgi:transcriptional regulator with XRE-family HTH domain
MSGVGEEVKRLRQAKGWTQEQLAVYAGSSQPTVNLLEAGKRNPSATTLEKLARALGVEVADFFPKPQEPQPSLEDAARSDEFQEALAVLFRGLARRGQRIVQQGYEHGPSAALSSETAEFHEEGMVLSQIKDTELGPSMFGHDSDELAEAEDDYREANRRLQEMVRQVVDAPEKAKESHRLREARRLKAKKEREIEESRADAS